MFDSLFCDTPPRPRPTESDALNDLVLLLLEAMAEKTPDEKKKAEIALMCKYDAAHKTVQEMARYAGDPTGGVSVDVIRGANAALDEALTALNRFLSEHPTPEHTIFDKH